MEQFLFLLFCFALAGFVVSSNLPDGDIFDVEEVELINKEYGKAYKLKEMQNQGLKISFFDKIFIKYCQRSVYKYLRKKRYITIKQSSFATLCGYGEMVCNERIIESNMRMVKDDGFWVYKYIPKEVKPY